MKRPFASPLTILHEMRSILHAPVLLLGPWVRTIVLVVDHIYQFLALLGDVSYVA